MLDCMVCFFSLLFSVYHSWTYDFGQPDYKTCYQQYRVCIWRDHLLACYGALHSTAHYIDLG